MDTHGLKLEKKIRQTCKNQQKISMVKLKLPDEIFFDVFLMSTV